MMKYSSNSDCQSERPSDCQSDTYWLHKKYKWIGVLLCLFLSSCQYNTIKNLKTVPPTQTTFKNTYFSNTKKDYLYKAKIEAFGNQTGGILVIKKLNTAHHRIVFTTEFGAKIFDFEFEAADFKVNYIIEALDKKLLIRVLQRDFERLIKEDLPLDKQYETAQQHIYQSEWKGKTHFYFFSKNKEKLEKVVQSSKTKEKVVLLFKGEAVNHAKDIRIVHQNIPLTIELKSF